MKNNTNTQKYKFIKKFPPGAPEVKEAILYLPDKEGKNVSCGMFRTILEIGALAKRKLIISALVNVPIFQITVNFNPQNKPPRCPILLGTPIEDYPRDRKVFLLPEEVINNSDNPIVFDVSWKDWQITDVLLNGQKPLVIFNL